jgi:short/branched chain acyl-CoA dehydrogenase
MMMLSRIVTTALPKTTTKKLIIDTKIFFFHQSFPFTKQSFSSSSIPFGNDGNNPLVTPSSSLLSLPCPITQFTEEETLVQHSVRTFAQNDILPHVRQMENDQKINNTLISSLFQQGLMGLEIPDTYNGGSNLNFTSACIAIEEISKVDPSVALLVDVQNTLVNNAIRFWGSEELKNDILPRLAFNTIGAFCLSESHSGSDAFAMTTKAIPSSDNSYFTINGTKMWISNAREAGIFLVFANVDPSRGYKGITAFVVDANCEGVHIGPTESKLGLKANSTCSVSFDNVKVLSNRVLGEIGLGYKYCIEILNEGRIGIAAQQVGIAKGCMDVVLPCLFERKQFGQYIGDFQSMQHQYAQLMTDIHAAEVMLYNACRLKENGRPFVKEASMTKLFSSQVAEKVTSKSIELMGGIGYTTDTLVEKFYRDCKVGSIYEGTSNMQLQTIAKIVKAEHQ